MPKITLSLPWTDPEKGTHHQVGTTVTVDEDRAQHMIEDGLAVEPSSTEATTKGKE